MKQKKAITNEVGARYIKSNKKDKGKILDEFCATTGYSRTYAARILKNSPGKVLGYGRIAGRKGTKPGSLLKKVIPIRTFADWNEKKPGFIEAGLVGHDGGNGSGDFVQSLNFVDILTGWDESAACINKAQKHLFSRKSKSFYFL